MPWTILQWKGKRGQIRWEAGAGTGRNSLVRHWAAETREHQAQESWLAGSSACPSATEGGEHTRFGAGRLGGLSACSKR